MKRTEIFLLAVLLVVTVFLRFPDLGYSDYIGDEHKAFFRPDPGQTAWEFFMEQRKGPMQFAVSYIPYLFTNSWRNELAERIPFTIFNAASVFVFYAFIRKLTGNMFAAFLAAFLVSVNGFIVGFSRIAQYQSLNLFFSFLALYFYTDFWKPSDRLLRNTLVGTAAFSLSLLSHWDAIFALPPILIFLGRYISNRSVTSKEKIRIIGANLALGGLILLPYLIPYVSHQISNPASAEYFQRRVDPSQTDPQRFEFLIKLYNPFFVLEFLIIAGALSLLFIKRTWIYLVWFAINFAVFAIFVKKADTHVYNFIIPAIALGSIGLVLLIQKLPKLLRPVFVAVVTVFLAFFVWQSYLIFVDHKTEYPWRREEILNIKGYQLVTREYTLTDRPPLFGFPLSRHWNEINNFINERNRMLGENFGYQTNEAKTISERYIDAGYRSSRGFYAVGIKRPLSFVNDWNFPQFGGKTIVHEISDGDEIVVRIYRVDPR